MGVAADDGCAARALSVAEKSPVKWNRGTLSGHVPNFGLFVGVRFFCLARNKQNRAALSGTGRGLRAMAKSLSICLDFPPHVSN